MNLEQMKNALLAIKNYASDQAEDEGLWFDAETAPEAYLQSQLRALHGLIERVDYSEIIIEPTPPRDPVGREL